MTITQEGESNTEFVRDLRSTGAGLPDSALRTQAFCLRVPTLAPRPIDVQIPNLCESRIRLNQGLERAQESKRYPVDVWEAWQRRCCELEPETALDEQPLISVVDDDQSFRDSLGRLFRSLGYTVALFPSAKAFLASPALSSTACLVADIHMPGMSGDELYRYLVETGRSIPTILVTAYPDDALRQRMLNEGVKCYLHKPLEEAHLLRCLRSIIAPAA